MPHEERMLKSAYKSMGKGGSVAGFYPSLQKSARIGGYSQTPYSKKGGNDLNLNQN